jgi:hypothetical protein
MSDGARIRKAANLETGMATSGNDTMVVRPAHRNNVIFVKMPPAQLRYAKQWSLIPSPF